MTAKKIVVLGTGGTIAGTAASSHDTLEYTAAQLGINDLLASITLSGGAPLVAEQVAQINSKDMSFAVWRNLALRCSHWLGQADVAGLVITHGTDTLEETAFFLQQVLSPAKPVVLTCAMRPATALAPDGPQNLRDAIAVASSPARGVVTVCAGTIRDARDVAKQHTYRLDPFTSGDAGAIGYVEDGKLRLLRDWPRPEPESAGLLEKVSAGEKWPRVEIVMNYAGAGGAIIDGLVAQGVRGLVVAGSGNGDIHHELEAALMKAQASGVKVIRASRCAQGVVLARASDSLPHSNGLSAVKARIALMLALLA